MLWNLKRWAVPAVLALQMSSPWQSVCRSFSNPKSLMLTIPFSSFLVMINATLMGWRWCYGAGDKPPNVGSREALGWHGDTRGVEHEIISSTNRSPKAVLSFSAVVGRIPLCSGIWPVSDIVSVC
ncbi:hypothetical protein B0H63DRAFT_319295 [Podospora didyma]|uniref:Uncharacterized protein n=1 Tax=Podospora didyma TaxID=330526 RepID=A0AAE0N4P5_9PEZI|nr:hypothetical protein B0H63DRAFT_319295 [Podospora didyma]